MFVRDVEHVEFPCHGCLPEVVLVISIGLGGVLGVSGDLDSKLVPDFVVVILDDGLVIMDDGPGRILRLLPGR